MFLTGHKRPPFINEAGYSRKNIYKRIKRDKNSRGFMDNRRRTMDKPMDSELPTGLSTALQRGRLPTRSTASAAACQTKCNYGVCQI
jgi:hypothetical protein